MTARGRGPAAATKGGRACRDERGAVIVLFAMTLVILAIMAALVVGIGNASQERRQAQNAADAASLAGAQDITGGDLLPSQVVATVKAYVARNFGGVAWAGCADAAALAIRPDVGETCISWDRNPPLTTKVRVLVPVRITPVFFGGVAGLATVGVTAAAAASVGQPSSVIAPPCALCTLGDTDLAVSFTLQNGNVAVTGGGVYVGGSLTCGPHGTMTSTANGVVGTIGGKCNQVVPAATNVASIPDPLASLPAHPDYSSLTAKPDCWSGVATPGIYNNIGTCVLTPGLYVIAGGSIGGNGLTTLTGLGVTVFLTCGSALSPRSCNPGEAGASVNAGGNGVLTLTACPLAPCVGGATAGMLFWFDRNDVSTFVAHGNGAVNFVGTVYGTSVSMDVAGTPAGTAGTCLLGFCSEVVVRNVSFSGQGTLNVDYHAGQNVVITSPPKLPQLTN
ncbi:MAG: pilus assembly protein TadG-related protein [Acidimicrobiales bacterium]